MKKNSTISVIILLVFALALSGTVFASGPPEQPSRFHRHHGRHGDGGAKLLNRYLRENLTVQTLSEMTRQPVDTIASRLRDERLPDLLSEYQIDRGAFRTTMHTKMKDLVNQLAKIGYLTPQQEKKIVDQMEFRSQRRALMTRLVEKGIADGTITDEQAQLLMRKPR
ncbi:MAG: hypothetical protein P8Y74_00780 [Desulfobacterales bacterium]|jgi:hypothetical protein